MEAQTARDARSDNLESRVGKPFLGEEVPAHRLPIAGMPAEDAMRLIGEELVLDGDPQRNLATFVTTWMEPEAQQVIAEILHVNFIAHAGYPRTGGDRAALHQDAGRPVQRTRRDHRCAHPGLVR